jgi:hypothetical protein
VPDRLSAGCAGSRSCPLDFDRLLVDPDVESSGVEAHEATHLDERDPPFGNQSPYVTRSHAERRCNRLNVE